MHIRLLGTAAGGGVPQWNCNCAVCHHARSGSGRVRPRTQSSVAISADGRRWFLLNASPDIRAQIEAFPPLHPSGGQVRGSPIEAVLLTNADLDHTLGLFLLREGEALRVHAIANVQRALSEGLALKFALDPFCGLKWVTPPPKASPLRLRDGSDSGLTYHAIPLWGKPPRFFRERARERAHPARAIHGGSPRGQDARAPRWSVAYYVRDRRTGGSLLFAPETGRLTQDLVRLMVDSDVLLFDGTFWSETEMQDQGAGTLLASEMGHLAISGQEGSLNLLAGGKAVRKIYTHINNTNPILLEDSPQRAAVVAAGCEVGWDGMEIEV